MTNGIFVLLMLWGTSSSNGGLAVVQQEFSSREKCEAAREVLIKAHNGSSSVLRAQGCFQK
jgi:hypothetical protein